MMTTVDVIHAHFTRCNGVSTDTRSLTPGSLFVALKGPNFDANRFAAQALEQGCRYAIVDDPAVATDERYLLVSDVLSALQELGRFHRRRFDIPFVGITGSNGKTTTKELAFAVLNAAMPTLATTGNLNNHIGVPLTLLRVTEEHRIALIEMGANKPGDIAELCAIAEPTHGVLTNVGKAHLEGFGSLEGVLRTKTELYRSVRERDGLLFVHADDPVLMQESTGCRRHTYGRRAEASTSGDLLRTGPFMSMAFAGNDGLVYEVETRLIGGYNLSNALAAVALGQHFGVPDEVIATGLATYMPTNNRSQLTDTGRNRLVLDAYNANPGSMRVAVENFAALHSERPKLVILGDMRELGSISAEEHRNVVELVDRMGLSAIYVGEEFCRAVEKGSRTFTDVAGALHSLEHSPVRGHLVLIKGSRGIRLESLLPAL